MEFPLGSSNPGCLKHLNWNITRKGSGGKKNIVEVQGFGGMELSSGLNFQFC